MGKQKKESRKGIIFKYIFFYMYLALLVYFVFFAEMFNRDAIPEEYRYNFVLLKEIGRFIRYRDKLGLETVLLNLVGNIIAFIPFGAFLPAMVREKMNSWSVIIASAAFSISIELVQLITKVGSCDVDDVILNTIGGAVGYVFYFCYVRLFRKTDGK